MTTPTSLVERLRKMRAAGDAKIAELEQRHISRIDDAAKRRDAAIEKLDAKLESDAAMVDAEITAFEDEINQITNGAPK